MKIKKGKQKDNKKNFIIKLDECKYIGKDFKSSSYLMRNGRVVKLYNEPYICKMDYKIFTLESFSSFFPKTYEFCGHYIIREYVKGTSLKTYILRNGFTNSLCLKLITFLEKIYIMHIKNVNVKFQHLFMKDDGTLLLIDINYNKKICFIFSDLFLNLRYLGILDKFSDYLKTYNIKLYNEWGKQNSK